MNKTREFSIHILNTALFLTNFHNRIQTTTPLRRLRPSSTFQFTALPVQQMATHYTEYLCYHLQFETDADNGVSMIRRIY